MSDMQKNPDLKVEYIPIEELSPYEKNARKHAEADLNTIVESIRQFGFSDPIGVWGENNLIVEGHGRLMAAKKLGMETVPVIHLYHLTDEQRRAYALAHNKTAEMSEWDFDLLGGELDDIFDIDMEQFGFESQEFDLELHSFDEAEDRSGNMAERYLVPPFSVLYANRQDWLARKRQWVSIGLRSEMGRGDHLADNSKIDLESNFSNGGGRTEQSIQKSNDAKYVRKSKAYSDGLIKKMHKMKVGEYIGDSVSK